MSTLERMIAEQKRNHATLDLAEWLKRAREFLAGEQKRRPVPQNPQTYTDTGRPL
jgi:hypothetical protein